MDILSSLWELLWGIVGLALILGPFIGLALGIAWPIAEALLERWRVWRIDDEEWDWDDEKWENEMYFEYRRQYGYSPEEQAALERAGIPVPKRSPEEMARERELWERYGLTAKDWAGLAEKLSGAEGDRG